MSRSRRPPVGLVGMAGALIRFAAPTTLAALVGCVAVAAVLAGPRGALGAALGAVVVGLFFGADLLVMRLTARWDPAVTFVVVMAEYGAKILLLGAFLLAFRGTTAFDTTALAVTIAVGTVVWLAAMTLGYSRIRTYTVEPE